MKKSTAILVLVALGTLLVMSAPPLTQTRPFTVNATNQAPSFLGYAPAGTNDLIRLHLNSKQKFVVASNGIPTLLKFGSVVTSSDGSVTQSFGITYTNVPTVVVSQLGLNTTTTNTLVVTTTNFILTTSKAGQTNAWHAIGEL